MWFYLAPFKFPDKCLGFGLELVDKFTEIVRCAFGPYIGHHQPLLMAYERKLERIQVELYKQNVFLLFNQIYVYV